MNRNLILSFSKFIILGTSLAISLACEKKKESSTETPPPEAPAVVVSAPTITKYPMDGSAVGLATTEFSSTDSSHDHFECSLNGAGYEACSSPYTASTVGFGTHSLNIKSVNAQGVSSSSTTSSWLQSDQFKAFDLAGGTSGEKLTIGGVAIDSNGIMYLGSWEGPRVSTNGGVSFSTVTSGLVSGFRTYRIRVGSDNKVYAALQSGVGISANQGTSWTKYTTSEGLGDNAVSDVFVDSNGKVFAATGNGLSIKSASDVGFTNYTAGLASASCQSVTKDNSGRVLVGTASGLSRSTTSSETSFSTLVAGSVSSVSAYNQTIVINTSNSGLKISLNDGATWTTKNTTHGLPSNYVYNVYVDSKGVIYATTSAGFAYSVNQGSTWKSYGTGNGMSDSNLYALNVDGWGRILIGSSSGFSMTHFSGSSAIPVVSSDLTAPVVVSSDLATSNAKSYKYQLSWTKAEDAESTAANLEYGVFMSTADNISTVSEAYTNGQLYNGRYYNDINSLTVYTIPNSSYYYTIVAKNPSGAKSIYGKINVVSPKITWTEMADLTSTSGAANIWYGAAVSFANKIWMLAGMDGQAVTLTNKVISSTDGATWSVQTGTGDFNYRYGHSAVVFNNKIWMTGGIGGASNLGNDSQNSILSSTDGVNWTTEVVTADWVSGGIGRMYSQLIVFNGKMYHIGGKANTSSTTKYADVYSTSDGTSWSMSTSSLTGSGGLSLFSAVSFNGKIYVVNDTNVYSSVDSYSWTNEGAHGIPGSEHHVKVVGEKMMCLFGGAAPGGYLDLTSCSMDGKTWTQYSDAHPFEIKIGDYGMATEHNGSVYFMMGAKYGYPKKVYRLD